MVRKYTEEGLARKAKMQEIGIQKYNILFNNEIIGQVIKDHRKGWKAIDKNGRYVGSGSTKKEARFFVAWQHVGDEGIKWD